MTAMRKWLWPAAALALTLAIAAGCGTNQRSGMQPMQNHNPNQGQELHQMQNQRNYNANHAAEDRVEIAQAAAEKISNLPGVRQANVLITRNNAYVAAVLDGTAQQLSRQLEDQIAREVRKVRPDTLNVYVSTNPDFVDRINNYIVDVQQGRPVAGFVEQLNEMVQRLFPDAR
jgi:YhcN/YlaJ family sporulation lipoprotein